MSFHTAALLTARAVIFRLFRVCSCSDWSDCFVMKVIDSCLGFFVSFFGRLAPEAGKPVTGAREES
jgi:hypothetical protein